jgi:hypothetical protein
MTRAGLFTVWQRGSPGLTQAVFYISYLIIVCFIAYEVAERAVVASAPRAVAAYDMPANHRLVPEDLMPIDQEALVGKYLRNAIKRGEVIASASVSPQPAYTKQPNMIAAIITVPKARVAGYNIREGMKVQVCRGAQPFGAAATVLALSCDSNTSCSVTLDLPKITGQFIDPAALTDATIASIAALVPCRSGLP